MKTPNLNFEWEHWLKEQYLCSYDFTACLNNVLLENHKTLLWTRLAYVTDGSYVSQV